MECYWNSNNYAILPDSLASIRFVAKKISLKIKQRLQKDFGPIVIPHRPELSNFHQNFTNWFLGEEDQLMGRAFISLNFTAKNTKNEFLAVNVDALRIN